MLAHSIWAFCLYLSLIPLFTTYVHADSHPATDPFGFHFRVEEDPGINPAYWFDINDTFSLDQEFSGIIPIHFVDFNNEHTAQVDYSPTVLMVVPLDNILTAETYRFPDGDLYTFDEGPNMVVTTAGNLLTITILPLSVPEPAPSVLLLSGLVMVGLAKRKRDSKKRRSSRL